MKKKSAILFHGFLVCAILLLFACKDAQQEAIIQDRINNANAVMQEALQTEMPKYAPEEYQLAQYYYNQGKENLTQEKYVEANQSYDNYMNAMEMGKERTQEFLADKKQKEDAAKAASDALAKQKALEEQQRIADQKAQEEMVKKQAAEAAASKKVTYYTVKRGDTLRGISRKFYKTEKRWIDVYNANKKVLGYRHVVKAGQRLKIIK